MVNGPNDWMLWLWGILGGLVRQIQVALDTNVAPGATQLLSNTLIAGFCASIFAKLVAKVDMDLTFAAAGAAGYLGVKVIDLAINLVQRKG